MCKLVLYLSYTYLIIQPIYNPYIAENRISQVTPQPLTCNSTLELVPISSTLHNSFHTPRHHLIDASPPVFFFFRRPKLLGAPFRPTVRVSLIPCYFRNPRPLLKIVTFFLALPSPLPFPGNLPTCLFRTRVRARAHTTNHVVVPVLGVACYTSLPPP